MSMKKMLAVVAAAACVAFAAPAFAANPFSDVPMHHWAYDAVDTLASHGVIQGYPDGTFKGNKPITRYEMSMMVARAMSAGALSGEDSALLKKLMVEFKDELDSLGVRVDNLESRMNAVELGGNGWKINGEIRMTAKWTNDKKEDGITFDRWRLWLRRSVNENLDLTVRIDAGNFKYAVMKDGKAEEKKTFGMLKVGQFYGTVKDFFFGTQARFGLFPTDWEGDDGMYYYDSFAVSQNVFGLELKKVFSAGEFTALLASTEYTGKFKENRSNFLYGLRFKMTPTERVWLSLNGQGNSDWRTLWATLGFKVVDDVELKGSYFWNRASKGADTTHAWKAVLSVDEKKLGFTDLYVEYAHQDKGFYAPNAEDNGQIFGDGYSIGQSKMGDVNAWTVAATQNWTDKISTQLHYINATTKIAKGHDLKESTYGASVAYKYNPNLKFTLGYDKLNAAVKGGDKDKVWFRTSLTF